MTLQDTNELHQILQIEWNDDLKTYVQSINDYLHPSSYEAQIEALLAWREQSVVEAQAGLIEVTLGWVEANEKNLTVADLIQHWRAQLANLNDITAAKSSVKETD